jgi:hypothetical protein
VPRFGVLSPYVSYSVRGMASRAVWLAFVLVGIVGCSDDPHVYMYRQPCDASPDDCCPLGTHEARQIGHDPDDPSITFVTIVCVWDGMVCAAWASAPACQDAGADAP